MKNSAILQYLIDNMKPITITDTLSDVYNVGYCEQFPYLSKNGKQTHPPKTYNKTKSKKW